MKISIKPSWIFGREINKLVWFEHKFNSLTYMCMIADGLGNWLMKELKNVVYKCLREIKNEN